MTTREDRIHTVKDFLSRPIIIHTGTWSSSVVPEGAGSQLYTTNFPEALITNAMYQEKLTGFVGLRATLVVKVQVNSQPFQQGRLMLQYFPYAQYMPNRVALVNSTLQGRSGCPRTDLDLSVGTEIEMRIPYVSPHVYYNLITGQGSFGSIYLIVYSQLRDQISGTGAVEYTVWAHLEDVDIQYPTGANIYTGNSPNFASLSKKMAAGKFTEKDVRQIWNDKSYAKKPDKIFAQMSLEIKQLKDNATISQGIGQVSEGLSTMSRIPILGNLFTKPAWISAQASNIFKMLGFSKPTIQGLPCESKLRGQTHMNNYDGADASHKMALSAENQIETKSGLAGTSADEMDLSHVLSIPNYWDRFSWDTTAVTGTQLWNNYVTPMKIKSYSVDVTDRFRCTHMGYVANTHGYWRGSIVYTFKFVKTQFHSGRIQISFIPFYFNSTISSGEVDVSRSQKMIVDLRTSTEVSFTVPYVSTRPWMFCVRPEASWLGANNVNMYNAVTGIVRVQVLNQLVAANNVYQAIDVIAEVSGGPDLTFAAPCSPSYIPYSGNFTVVQGRIKQEEKEEEYDNNIYPRGKRAIEENPEKIIAQVMGEDVAIQRNDAQHGQHPIAIDTHQIGANWSPEAHCIGEKIMSIRQLIKRFGSFNGLIFSNLNPAAVIAPFSVLNATSTVGGQKATQMYEYYYYLYAFWRGSMRIKAVPICGDPRDDTTRTYIPKASYATLAFSLINSVQDTFNTLISRFSVGGIPAQVTGALTNPMVNMGNSLVQIPPNLEGVAEIEVPYYNVSHISPATTYTSAERPISINKVLKGHLPPAIVTISNFGASTYPVVGSTGPAIEQNYVQLYRAPGDDFSFMYLVGVPPLVNVLRDP